LLPSGSRSVLRSNIGSMKAAFVFDSGTAVV